MIIRLSILLLNFKTLCSFLLLIIRIFKDPKIKFQAKGKFLNRINSDIGRSFLSLFITLFNFEMRSK